MKLSYILTIVFVFSIHLVFAQFKPSVITTNKIHTPNTLNDCFIQLDTILIDAFKQEVKKLPKEIATLKLEYFIGGYLLFKWKLNYIYSSKGAKFRKKAPKFIYKFFDCGVKETSIIRRIIFKSYYNYLHNIPVDIAKEADYYKNKLKLNSFEILTLSSHSHIDNKIRRLEDSLLENYKLSFMNTSDTLGIHIRHKTNGTIYLLSGVLIEKSKNNIGKLFIFDIACSNRNTYALSDSIKIQLNDTITYNLNKCFKLNYQPPTYITGKKLMWNTYINKKYKK